MRCFIATPIPDGVRKSISNYINRVRNSLSGIRWVKEDNIHITIRFLGEINEETVEKTKELIRLKGRVFKPFNCEIGGIGYFPSARRAKVIWVGIKEGADELRRVFSELEEEIIGLGFKKEKPFHPHLTIGRAKGPRPLNLPDIEGHIFQVREIILYRSTLTPSGPIYEPLIRTGFSS
ncbi:MAG TPA: RNA 2',3'-cyclic phosphodiesterase [bacterium (Candidatus Stahlbacteria)]|nr:RNA 2',3'-cyclic phosphodiesterase [Candidatus Stahlbacteria bacterium]